MIHVKVLHVGSILSVENIAAIYVNKNIQSYVVF